MNVTLCVICDGRTDYLEATVAAADANLNGITERLLINDSGSPEYADWLQEKFPTFKRIDHVERRGLGGAVRSAWTEALATSADYVWHLEDDMLVTEPIDLHKLARLLVNKPYLAQLVLRRYHFAGEGIPDGGQFAAAPDEYEDHTETFADNETVSWVEHSTGTQGLHVFSFNPCLIPRRIIELALQDSTSNMLESAVTNTLLANGYKFAYYGARSDAPRASHVGTHRSTGYRW